MEDSSDRWPRVFDSLKNRLAEAGECVTLAESWEEERDGARCARKLTCGLVREDEYETLTGDPELGHKVDSSGPYPSPRESECIPRFWIFGTAAIPDHIEPLVLSWSANNHTVQQPEPGLLMTYGLMPRVEANGITHWDEPTAPTPDVLTVNPVSRYVPFHETPSSVLIRRDYLQDYASLRHRSIVCVFYERWIVRDYEEARRLLGAAQYREWRFRDAYVRIQTIEGDDSRFHIDIWGHRLLIRPGPLPVSEDANRFGALTWPGVPVAINDENWRHQGMTYVYVKDEVLSRFEGRPEYEISPENGGVSFGAQWGVSYCNRIERDLIRLEVFKLYEGNPPDIVRHYHEHAVAPPLGTFADWSRVRNIAVRARDVVHALVRLGDAIAALATQVLARPVSSSDVVSIDRQWLDHHGWWNAEAVEPICRHVPLSTTRDSFVERCKDLHRLIGEGLREKLLRELLSALGVDAASLKDLRSLRLLTRLVELARLAQDAGLDLAADSTAVIARFTAPTDPSPCRNLFALNDVRQLDAHRSSSSFSQRLNAGLITFGVDPASTTPGYGRAIDAMYDALAAELSACADALETA